MLIVLLAVATQSITVSVPTREKMIQTTKKLENILYRLRKECKYHDREACRAIPSVKEELARRMTDSYNSFATSPKLDPVEKYCYKRVAHIKGYYNRLDAELECENNYKPK